MYAKYRNEIISLSKPSLFCDEWNAIGTKKCIMMCHDQDIDRRIMQEAKSLTKRDWHVLIVCLSHTRQDEILTLTERIFVHRIGLSKIVPDCSVYWSYQKIRYLIEESKFLIRFAKKIAHKLNGLRYKALLKLTYRGRNIHFPLPFDFCFKHALDGYTGSFIMAHDLPALKASAERALELSVPLLYDAHELYPQQKVFSQKQKDVLENREKEYIKKCSGVMSVSPSLMSIMARKNNLTALTGTILNAHPFHSITTTTSLHALINKPTNEAIILFQGGVLKNRNLINIVKGFLLFKNKNVNLVFLGPRDKKLENHLIHIKEKSRNPNIFFLDSVAQDVLLDITSTATFGIVPYVPCDINTEFCMPNKFFEYIQAELPILYHRELKEVDKIMTQIGGGGMGADLSSPQKVKAAFEHMLQRDLHKDRQAMMVVKNKICWESEEKKFIDIVNKINKN